jgi:ABC-type Fe3+/spermidine/putrescine transport system ATPase subunit
MEDRKTRDWRLEIGDWEINRTQFKIPPEASKQAKSKIQNPKSKIHHRVQEMLDLVGLAGFAERSVNELSGGEAQRVALARSLAPQPRLLMLDEPLGALDRALRERLMGELHDILKRVGVTAIYVTHDQAEAFAIADRVVVMQAGRIAQVGPPEEIYHRPATAAVARFLGLTNLAEGRVTAPGWVASAWGELAVETGDFQTDQAVTVLIRPEAARLHPPGETALRGKLSGRSFRGGRYKVEVRPEQGPALVFELPTLSQLPLTVGQTITIELDAAGVVLLPASPAS